MRKSLHRKFSIQFLSSHEEVSFLPPCSDKKLHMALKSKYIHHYVLNAIDFQQPREILKICDLERNKLVVNTIIGGRMRSIILKKTLWLNLLQNGLLITFFVFDETDPLNKIAVSSDTVSKFEGLSDDDSAWKMFVFGVILARIFLHSDWIRRDTEYFSVFSPNAGKCRPE